MQEKKIGPCRMNVNNTRYYFDWNIKKCLSFEYGGKKDLLFQCFLN